MSRGFRFPSRLYPIVDDLGGGGRSCLEIADAMLYAGVRFLQLRSKTRTTREFVDIGRAVKERCDAVCAQLIVNDRVDVARCIDAAGVHLGQTDLPVAAARDQLGADKIIGFSTHNLDQARAAEDAGGADYIGFGPVFATRTKENPDPEVGLEGLRRVRAAVRLPIVAIGGIEVDAAPEVLAAGADAVAMIGAIVRAPDITATVRHLLRLDPSR